MTDTTPRRYTSGRISPDTLRQLHSAGVTQSSIAQHYGITVDHIRRLERAHGLPERPKGKRTGPSVKEALTCTA